MSKLLTTQNYKTVKGEKLGYKTHILYMAPNTKNSTGTNLCPMATKGCIKACLFSAGMGKFSNVVKARTRKADYFVSDRTNFMNDLYREISHISLDAKLGDSLIPTIRLNGTTDIQWENIIIKDGKNIFELFPDIIFYDYTKIFNRFEKNLPSNYHLVYSYTGEISSFKGRTVERISKDILGKGYNVSAVFRTATLPKTFLGYPVVNGDETDLRFKDGKGVVVGLTAKGDAKKDTSGFVVDL